MRVYSKENWDITHSLTPQPRILSPKVQYKINMPEIPQINRLVMPVNPMTKPLNHQGSRKRRLAQQKNTQIQRSNRMLYQKIRKIMQKGHLSERKIKQPQSLYGLNQQNLRVSNNSQKPLSLPQISQSRTVTPSLSSTKSELNSILGNRQQFAEKYFKELTTARQNLVNVHTQQYANLQVLGWKAKILILNHGQFLIIRAKKGKKQITKKYIYQKVKKKIQNNLQQWVSSKLQFQV